MSRKQERKKRRQRALEDVRLKEHPEHTKKFYYDEQLVRGARVNRFMFVRYMSAFIFFLNLSWFVLILSVGSWGCLVPLFNALTAGIALVECMVSVARDYEELKYGEKLYLVSVVLTALVAVFTLVMGRELFFPFLTLPVYGAVYCLISIAAELLVLRRLKKMRDHTDKRYERYARVSAEASKVS